MRPAGNIRSFREGNCNVRARGVQEPLASHLSPLADSFDPRPTSKEQKNQRQLTNYDLDRSPARTGLGETKIPWDSIQNEVATIGTAKPIEIGKPVAMADVAVPSGPAGTGAGGPVATEISMTTVTDRTEASGPRRRVTDAPVATGLCSQTGNDRTEAGGPAVTVARGPVGIVRRFRTAGETTETEMATGTGTQFLAVAEVQLNTIMVGVVGSAAPWFLTGWTNDVEVEFMIDTGCQVTILATSVFERMCDIPPGSQKWTDPMCATTSVG